MAIITGTEASEGVYGTWNPLQTPDTLYGLGGNDVLNGWGGDDVLYGGEGNDGLQGHNFDGADTMYGGVGNDNYAINVGDVVIEYANEGLDSIDLYEGVTGTYTLPENVENITVRGNANVIGNALGNSVSVLGSFNRTLDGRNGNDSLYGGGGADTVTGGEGNDYISTSTGDDILSGGAGNDSLFGGNGVDRHLYNTNAVFSAQSIGVDSVGGFTVGSDKVVFDKTTFNALTSASGNGFSVSAEFARVTTDSAAATSAALIVFNSSNGKLFYNQNKASSGFGSGAQFATITSAPSLAGNDFVIQA